MMMTETLSPKQAPVLVVGDAFVDRWMTARVDRHSAEAPIPIYDIISERLQDGGAANVAHALQRMGANAELATPNRIYSLPVKSRIVVDGVQVVRFDQFDQCQPLQLNPSELTDRIVVISDYGKGAINATKIKTVADNASEIWINSKHVLQSSFECLDMARPSTKGPSVTWVCNQAEYERDKDWYDRQLKVWITKGPAGIEYRYGGKIWPSATRTAEARKVVSVCGAGDVTMAALVTSSLCGYDPEYMARYAMVAAAIAVEHPYTYCPTFKEIEERRYV